MRALVTGAAGFIGSHLSAALLDSGASVTGIDSFTDYYSRAIKEVNLGTVKGRPGFNFVEAALQDVDLTALLTGVTHVFHLAGQAGVRKSWGGDFDVYIRDNIQATQRLLEAVARTPIQKYVYPRALRFTATTYRCRCAKTRIYSRSPLTVSRSWPESISAICIAPIMACPQCLCAISRCMGRDRGLIWRFSAF